MKYDCEYCGAPNCHDYSVKLHINRKHFHCHGGKCRSEVIKKMFAQCHMKLDFTGANIMEMVIKPSKDCKGYFKRVGVSVIHDYQPLKAWE